MRRLVPGLAAVVVAAIAFFLWPTEARAIRRALADAAEAVSVPAGEGDLQRVARAAALARRLATDVVVEAGPDGPAIQGRDMVIGLASRLRMTGPVTVSFTETDLAIDGATGRAIATGAVQVSGDRPGELAGVDDSGLTVTLTKVDGAWLIARVALVPAVRR
jgi:hypothetical protein